MINRILKIILVISLFLVGMDQVTFDKDGSSRVPLPLNVDDDRLYQPHSDSGEESEEEGATQGNINRFKHRLRDSESASETGSVGSKSPVDGDAEERRKEEEEKKRRESDSSDEDIIIEHVSLSHNVPPSPLSYTV